MDAAEGDGVGGGGRAHRGDFGPEAGLCSPSCLCSLQAAWPEERYRRLYPLTWEMMNDPSSTSAIEWSEDGARIVVRDSWALANNVLPKFFKHNRYASWVRALNAYSFKKVGGSHQWSHEFFRRGRPELLQRIVRQAAVGGAPSGRGAASSASAPANSTALVRWRDPARPTVHSLLAEERQHLLVLRHEMARLESEVAAVRHEEFQQRFEMVQVAEYMLSQLNLSPNLLHVVGGAAAAAAGPAEPKIIELSPTKAQPLALAPPQLAGSSAQHAAPTTTARHVDGDRAGVAGVARRLAGGLEAQVNFYFAQLAQLAEKGGGARGGGRRRPGRATGTPPAACRSRSFENDTQLRCQPVCGFTQSLPCACE